MTREERKTEIIKASARIFAKYGYHKAKIEDIAKEAGIGKGTIYEYFDSKKVLFQEMIKNSLSQYENQIKKIAKGEAKVKNKLIDISRYHGIFLSEHMDLAQSMMSQIDILSKEMKCWMVETREELFKTMEEVIQRGIDKGEFRANLDVEGAALSIIGGINQYYTKKIYIDKIKSSDIRPENIIDILYNGFKA